jgi:hypothetical protein
VSFDLLNTKKINFQKVIWDSKAGGKPLIDWKDNLRTNDFLVSQMQSLLKFISREVRPELSQAKNSSLRNVRNLNLTLFRQLFFWLTKSNRISWSF